tara:strand:+ start:86 stop:244 length:159 start_codon:yes stop_codon:yes gene_type:complete
LNNFSVLCIWLQEKERVKLVEEIEEKEEKVNVVDEEDAAELADKEVAVRTAH